MFNKCMQLATSVHNKDLCRDVCKDGLYTTDAAVMCKDAALCKDAAV